MPGSRHKYEAGVCVPWNRHQCVVDVWVWRLGLDMCGGRHGLDKCVSWVSCPGCQCVVAVWVFGKTPTCGGCVGVCEFKTPTCGGCVGVWEDTYVWWLCGCLGRHLRVVGVVP